MSYSPAIINQMFMNSLDNGTHTKEAETMFSGYIRDRLRDVQFSRKILPPQNVTRDTQGVQVSTRHDGLVWIGEIEPESRAMAITWTGEPDTQYLKSKRYEVPFFQIASPESEITQQELWASRTPIHKIVEKNTVNDMEMIADWYFLTQVEAAILATGQVVKGTATNAGAASGDIQPDDLVNLQALLTEEERGGKVMLINQTDLNKTMKWTTLDAGDKLKGEMVNGSWNPDNLYKLSVVVTTKTKLLTQGNIYLFSTPEYLGNYLVLGTTNFALKKERDVIHWSSWEFVAMTIANAYSIGKLEIYSGASSAVPAYNTLFTSRIGTPPTVYPQVVTY